MPQQLALLVTITLTWSEVIDQLSCRLNYTPCLISDELRLLARFILMEELSLQDLWDINFLRLVRANVAVVVNMPLQNDEFF